MSTWNCTPKGACQLRPQQAPFRSGIAVEDHQQTTLMIAALWMAIEDTGEQVEALRTTVTALTVKELAEVQIEAGSDGTPTAVEVTSPTPHLRPVPRERLGGGTGTSDSG